MGTRSDCKIFFVECICLLIEQSEDWAAVENWLFFEVHHLYTQGITRDRFRPARLRVWWPLGASPATKNTQRNGRGGGAGRAVVIVALNSLILSLWGLLE